MTQPKSETQQILIKDLWNSAPISNRQFNSKVFADLPPLVRRYLETAIAPGTPLASAVRLKMHGNIKLGQKWHLFQAEEVICWNRGIIWQATAWMKGLPIWGADRMVDGVGKMQWKLLGLFPVMTGSGDDITRSAVGRMQGEGVWLPSVFCSRDISWTVLNESTVQATFTLLTQPACLTLTVSDLGLLEQVQFERWGNPEGDAYHAVNFGVIAQASRTFEGYTIPTCIRAGWFFGSNRFEFEGEFFRCTIDNATYR